MQLSEFKIGNTYSGKLVDFAPPDGSPVLRGKNIKFTVLDPVNEPMSSVEVAGEIEKPSKTEIETWKQFLRIHNHNSNRTHLLHPAMLEEVILEN